MIPPVAPPHRSPAPPQSRSTFPRPLLVPPAPVAPPDASRGPPPNYSAGSRERFLLRPPAAPSRGCAASVRHTGAANFQSAKSPAADGLSPLLAAESHEILPGRPDR